MADPDYDLVSTDASAASEAVREARLAYSRANRSLIPMGPVPRLPDTATEATGIAPSIRVYTRAEPTILLGKNARKGAFQAARGVRASSS